VAPLSITFDVGRVHPNVIVLSPLDQERAPEQWGPTSAAGLTRGSLWRIVFRPTTSRVPRRPIHERNIRSIAGRSRYGVAVEVQLGMMLIGVRAVVSTAPAPVFSWGAQMGCTLIAPRAIVASNAEQGNEWRLGWRRWTTAPTLSPLPSDESPE